MKTKIFVAVLMLVPMLTSAQIINTYEWSDTVSVNSQDTIYFAFRPAAGYSYVAPSNASTFNPPDAVVWAGAARLEFELISGTALDSVVALVKPINKAGEIYVSDDSTWAWGTAFSVAGANLTPGDGRVHSVRLTAFFDPAVGVAVILKILDLAGGDRVIALRLTPE